VELSNCMDWRLTLEFLVIVGALAMGARMGGVGLGLWGAVGLLVLVVGFDVPPANIPGEVLPELRTVPGAEKPLILSMPVAIAIVIEANRERCLADVQNSIGLVTALNPVLGYEKSAAIAKEALVTNRSVYQLVLEKNLLTQAQLDDILKPENMTHPRKLTSRG
jgi:fumarase hydratase-like protein/C4-dicarboxylate anaerobic transporter